MLVNYISATEIIEVEALSALLLSESFILLLVFFKSEYVFVNNSLSSSKLKG